MSKEVTKLKKKLMLLVKKGIHVRDNDTCQMCGKMVSGSNCQVSHVIPVSAGNALAFDETNMKILCYHCHLNIWHKHPLKARDWFVNKFPDRWAYLKEHENDEVHWKTHDYQEKIKQYENN